MPRPTILLTGFGPFPGVEANASARLVPLLAKAARKRFPAYRVRAEILPTEWERAPQLLSQIDDRVRPAISLHFGVSGAATSFELEARGKNTCRHAPDASGRLPPAPHIIADGRDEHGATLALDRVLARLAAASIPASISDDAGGYLCNAVLYHSLHRAQVRASRRIVGFVHIPSALSAGDAPGLTWPQAEHGALEIVGVAVAQHRAALVRT
jgi:pyroglutamyl-peptidase